MINTAVAYGLYAGIGCIYRHGRYLDELTEIDITVDVRRWATENDLPSAKELKRIYMVEQDFILDREE